MTIGPPAAYFCKEEIARGGCEKFVFETRRGAWAGAHLCRVRRADMDFGCRRASRVTRGLVCWRRAYAVSERRVFVCRAAGTSTP
jgi:hypothetical protein